VSQVRKHLGRSCDRYPVNRLERAHRSASQLTSSLATIAAADAVTAAMPTRQSRFRNMETTPARAPARCHRRPSGGRRAFRRRARRPPLPISSRSGPRLSPTNARRAKAAVLTWSGPPSRKDDMHWWETRATRRQWPLRQSLQLPGAPGWRQAHDHDGDRDCLELFQVRRPGEGHRHALPGRRRRRRSSRTSRGQDPAVLATRCAAHGLTLEDRGRPVRTTCIDAGRDGVD